MEQHRLRRCLHPNRQVRAHYTEVGLGEDYVISLFVESYWPFTGILKKFFPFGNYWSFSKLRLVTS